jgi:hypothetical protein
MVASFYLFFSNTASLKSTLKHCFGKIIEIFLCNLIPQLNNGKAKTKVK